MGERKSLSETTQEDGFIWAPDKLDGVAEFIKDMNSQSKRETWREPLEKAFVDIGDISGLAVFDAGPEGYASRFIAERIGKGRIVGVNKWLGFYRAVRINVGDLMDKVVLVYDDMRRMDYLKDCYFDLVVSYATIQSIESSTPGGTLPILHQFYRILKRDGTFLAVEHPPPQEVKTLDEAQQCKLELDKLHGQIYEPIRTLPTSELSEMLKEAGFRGIYWKMVSEGESYSRKEVRREINGLRNLVREVVKNQEQKEGYLREIQDLARQVKRIGLRTMPYYALYATKT